MQRLDTYCNEYEGEENEQEVLHVGTITGVNVYGYTCDVILKNGHSLMGVAITGVTGTAFSDKLNWDGNLNGSTCLLAYVLGKYYILALLPVHVDSEKNEAVRSVLPTKESEKLEEKNKKSSFSNFNSNNPIDLLPTDTVQRNADGAELSLLRGGLARLRATNMAQLIFGRFKDWGRLIARNLEVFTDFGEVTLLHKKKGRVGLTILGGAVYDKETAPKKEKWTFRAFLGDHKEEEKHRMFIQTNNEEQENKVTIASDTDGDLKIFAKRDVEITVERHINTNSKELTNIKAKKDINIKSKETINIFADGDINIIAKKAVNIKGNPVNIG